MVVDIPYKGIIGKVDIPYFTGPQAPLVYPQVMEVCSSYGRQKIVQFPYEETLFTNRCPSETIGKSSVDLKVWARETFDRVITTNQYYKDAMDGCLTGNVVSETAEKILGRFIFLDCELYAQIKEPVYNVCSLRTSPSLVIRGNTIESGIYQFRYDELPLVIPYLKSIEGKVLSNGEKVGEVSKELEDKITACIEGNSPKFRIAVTSQDFCSALPPRDIRVMDWLEASVKETIQFLGIGVAEELTFPVMRKLIQRNEGLNFACKPSVEEVEEALKGEI